MVSLHSIILYAETARFRSLRTQSNKAQSLNGRLFASRWRRRSYSRNRIPRLSFSPAGATVYGGQLTTGKPPKRPLDLNAQRWLVEQTFAWLNNRFRRLRVRYERLPPCYYALWVLACVRRCLGWVYEFIRLIPSRTANS